MTSFKNLFFNSFNAKLKMRVDHPEPNSNIVVLLLIITYWYKLYKSFTGSSTLNAFQKLVDFFKLDLNPNDLVLSKRKRYVSYFENDPNLKLVNAS